MANLIEEFDDLGVVTGWRGYSRNAKGNLVEIFIPRREEDIEAERDSLLRIR